jgi:hypothetical protein
MAGVVVGRSALVAKREEATRMARFRKYNTRSLLMNVKGRKNRRRVNQKIWKRDGKRTKGGILLAPIRASLSGR